MNMNKTLWNTSENKSKKERKANEFRHNYKTKLDFYIENSKIGNINWKEKYNSSALLK
jgi:hypothetical protein